MASLIWSILSAEVLLKILGVALATLLILGVAAYLYLTKNYGKWEKVFNIPGLKPVPLFGTEAAYLLAKKSSNDQVMSNYNAFKGHRMGLVYFGMRPTLLPRDIELVKSICIKDHHHFTDMFIDQIEEAGIGDGSLLFIFGEKWKRTRESIHAAFRFRHVKEVVPKFNECIRPTLKQLDTYAKTQEVLKIDTEIIQPLLLDIVVRAVCGAKMEAARDSNSKLFEMAYLLQTSVWRIILLFVAPELMCLLRIKIFNPQATDYIGKILRQLMKDHRENNIQDDFMGVILRIQQENEKQRQGGKTDLFSLSDETIVATIMQFFFDGILSAGTVLDVALLFLAKNPDMQEKAYEEIQSVMGDRMNADTLDQLPPFTDDDLTQLRYVEMIYDEAARFGCFPFVGRICTKEYQIPDTDIKIPKGFGVYLPIFGFHMDPRYFPDPETFDPMRFSAENRSKNDMSAYFPFGQGPRQCLGKNFVRVEGKCILANIIRSFRIHECEKTIPKLDWDIEVTGKIKGGLHVKVSRRE